MASFIVAPFRQAAPQNLSGKWPTKGFVIAGTTELSDPNPRVHDLPSESTSKTLPRSGRPMSLYGVPVLGYIGTHVLHCASLSSLPSTLPLQQEDDRL